MRMRNRGRACVELLAMAALVSGCGANAAASNVDGTESALNAAPLELTIGTEAAHRTGLTPTHRVMDKKRDILMTALNIEVTHVDPEQSARPKTFSRCPEDEDGLYIQITEYDGPSHGNHYASESPPYVKLFLSPQDCDAVWGAPAGVDVIHCGEIGWPAEAVNSYTVNGNTYQMQTP